MALPPGELGTIKGAFNLIAGGGTFGEQLRVTGGPAEGTGAARRGHIKGMTPVGDGGEEAGLGLAEDQTPHLNCTGGCF